MTQQNPVQQAPYPAPQMMPSSSYDYNNPPHTLSVNSNAASIDIFAPMTAGPIPIPQCESHPVSKHFIRNPDATLRPSQTNAFYGNLLLGGQGCSVWTHPYSLSWAKGQGNARSWGLAISHVDREQSTFGPPTSTGGRQYYFNPLGE
jgi:endo-1,3(4)-beta-glucanase